MVNRNIRTHDPKVARAEREKAGRGRSGSIPFQTPEQRRIERHRHMRANGTVPGLIRRVEDTDDKAASGE